MAAGRLIFLACALLLTTGCNNPYKPITGGTFGFAESPVAPNVFEVGYIAPSGLDAASSHQFALYRAAELTLREGKPCFDVVMERKGTGYRVESYTETTTDPTTGMTTTTTTYETVYYPMNTLLVRTLDQIRPGAHDAVELLLQAQREKVKLSRETLELLAKIPPITTVTPKSLQPN